MKKPTISSPESVRDPHSYLAHFFHIQRFIQTLYGLDACHSHSWNGLTDYTEYANHDLQLLNLHTFDYIFRLKIRLSYE